MIRKFGKFQCPAVMAILISLLFVGPGLADLTKADWPSEEIQNWNITGAETYQDQDLTLEGSIYVYGSLSLINVNVYIKSSEGNTHGIFVEDGGSLTVSGGSIQAYNPQHPMKMAFRGKVSLDGTDIQYLSGNENEPKSGIMVLSDDVQITNCDIGYAGGSGIYIYRSQAVLSGNKIHDAHWGVYLDSDTIFTEPNFWVSQSDLSYDPTDPAPIASSIVTLTATVHNSGGRDAAALVSFYDGDPKYGGILISENTKIIPGAGQLDFTTDWTAIAGSHTISVLVDRTGSVGESDEADNVATRDIDVTFMVQVMMLSEGGGNPSNIPVYAFKDNSYTGLSATTDESGCAYFPITDATGEYKFRADFLGYNFFSDPIQMPATMSGLISIDTGVVMVSARTSFQGEYQDLIGTPVYLFKPDGSYMSVSKQTGEYYLYAGFWVPWKSYLYRADYLGISQFSDPYTCSMEDFAPQVSIVFHEGLARISVKQDETVLNGVPVYVFTGTGSYLNLMKTTGSEGVPGQVEFYLPEGDYKFRTDYQSNPYWAKVNNQDIITLVRDTETPITINTGGEEVSIFVQDGANNGINGINVYAVTYPGNAYIGKSDVTKNGGVAKIRGADGSYRYRADYLGGQFWSDPITVPDFVNTEINLDIRAVTVSINKDYNGVLSGLGSGVPVYLFSASQSYLGQYRTSNSNGQVTFDLPTGQAFKFRTDYRGYQFMSPDAFTIGEGVAPYVNILHEDATIYVKTEYNDVETARDNVPVYVFTSAGSYLSQYSYTQNGGKAVFCLPVKAYKFRADYLNTQYMTDAMTPTVTHTISISEGKASITVTDGGNPVQSVPVYVFTSGRSYLSISGQTDANGHVEFQLAANSYDFRADFSSIQHWSGTQSISADSMTDITITENSRSISEQTSGTTTGSRSSYSFSYTIIKAAGLPIKEVPVYVYSGAVYLGITGTTDDLGTTVFTLDAGTYDFRVDYMGIHVWDNSVTVNADGSREFTITHRNVNIQITQTPALLRPERMNHLPVYLYSIGGVYLGDTKHTDETGSVTFNLPDLPYFQGYFKVKYTYLGYQYSSSEFYFPTDGSPLGLTIGISHQTVSVTVMREFKDPIGNYGQLFVPDGTPVYLFTSDPLSYLGESTVTHMDGSKSVAEFWLPDNAYSFRADYRTFQFWSGTSAQGLPEVMIKEAYARVQVTQGENGIDLVPLYVFNSNWAYLNENRVTQDGGYYIFQLPVESYHFRADLNGQQYKTTDPISLQWDDNSIFGIITDASIDVDGGDFQLTVTDGTDPIENANVYAFTMGGAYLSLTDTTNADGIATIPLTGGTFKFRIDYMGSQWWVDNSGNGFNPPSLATFAIPHQYVTTTVLYAGEPLEGVSIYLFTSGGSYLSKTNPTSSAGTVQWSLPQAKYDVRVDYHEGQYWIDDIMLDGAGEAFPEIDLAPDLMIEAGDITSFPGPPMIGETTTVSIIVHNFGLTGVSDVILSIYDGDPNDLEHPGIKIKQDQQIDYIEGKSESVVTFSWTPTVVGGKLFYIIVDKSNSIMEIDEANNEASSIINAVEDENGPFINNNEIFATYIGIYILDTHVTLNYLKIQSNQKGIYADGASVLVNYCEIAPDSEYSIYLINSAYVEVYNGYFKKSKTLVSDVNSILRSYKSLVLWVRAPDSTPIADLSINVQDRQNSLTGLLTYENGLAGPYRAMEFEQTALSDGSQVWKFNSPYTLSFTYQGIKNELMTTIVGKKNITMISGGDSDGDGGVRQKPRS